MSAFNMAEHEKQKRLKEKSDYLESLGYSNWGSRYTYDWNPPCELPFSLSLGSDDKEGAMDNAIAFEKWYKEHIK